MREIKFKVWDSDNLNMLEWDIVKDYGFRFHELETNGKYSHVFLQFTGLKDKNGVEIYEKDFYREIYSDGSGERICLVELKKHESLPSFERFIGFEIDYENLVNIEVIGNLYENHDLLK